MYLFYFDKEVLPITPESVTTKINGNNKKITLIDEGEVNILKVAGLTDISFDCLLPAFSYPFAAAKDVEEQSYYLDKFESYKTSKEPFDFIISRNTYNTSMEVSLEDYTIKESYQNGADILVQVKLKQYRNYGTKKVKIKSPPTQSNKVIETTLPRKTSSNAPSNGLPTTYTVKSGDCLWNIAKKFYGDGSQYNKIFNANKGQIRSANLIYPGQMLTIPK